MHLLNEHDLCTNTPQRWRKTQLIAFTRLVPPLPTGQNTDAAFPPVGEIPAARPAPVGGQLLPQAPGRGPAAVAEYPGHNAPAFALPIGNPTPSPRCQRKTSRPAGNAPAPPLNRALERAGRIFLPPKHRTASPLTR